MPADKPDNPKAPRDSFRHQVEEVLRRTNSSVLASLGAPPILPTTELIEAAADILRSRKDGDSNEDQWEKLENAYISHLLWRFSYPTKAFGQQMWFAWIVTLLIVSLVVCGLVFAFLQLQYAIDVGNISALETDIQIEQAGTLAFRSSVIGATVLIVSLAFFALYLKHVFQIRQPVPPHITIEGMDIHRLKPDISNPSSVDSSISSDQSRSG